MRAFLILIVFSLMLSGMVSATEGCCFNQIDPESQLTEVAPCHGADGNDQQVSKAFQCQCQACLQVGIFLKHVRIIHEPNFSAPNHDRPYFSSIDLERIYYPPKKPLIAINC